MPPAQPIAPPAYDDVTAPPVYVYNEPGAAQASVPSILQDSYNNPTHQVYPPGNTPQPKPMWQTEMNLFQKFTSIIW